jgi:hypothetical protein
MTDRNATMPPCESCGAPATDNGPAYDWTEEGQGRTRRIPLCDDCGGDYLHVLWGLAPSTRPESAHARRLAGEGRQR